MPKRQWLFGNDVAICDQCIKRLAVRFAQREGKSLEEWAAGSDRV